MAEDDATAAALRASEQARLRKERREAKIKAGGSARLNKISGIGGRIVGGGRVGAKAYGFGGALLPPTFSEAQLRQMMMLGGAAQGQAKGKEGEAGDDALLKMMAQMMSGFTDPSSPSSSAAPASNSFPFPPPGQQQQGVTSTDRYTLTFRLLHALLSTSLGLYLSLSLVAFTGTRTDRERQSFNFPPTITTSSSSSSSSSSPEEEEDQQRRKLTFFWLFATAEAVLLSSRFFLDNNRNQQPPGLLWSAVGFLPDPFRTYLSVVLRYGQIFMTVRADILACVFVLGVACWCRA
ncbi:hypothetical protein L249_2404 [Ophiocordyceps polyrhachis-furcata BCC 54312]|uniref:GET complex subunit GET2 n=1 Tax=Ophiocordyceps polyrhachis-furcata BCC 54312 TaxID=1330021 RepID=A0A367LSD8_9HYPO|nr:hypothetical protein L249_2404 [Ophiocordyceps polyrhachis-furcata BCC 54312]